jgi:hypothetical protein
MTNADFKAGISETNYHRSVKIIVLLLRANSGRHRGLKIFGYGPCQHSSCFSCTGAQTIYNIFHASKLCIFIIAVHNILK